MWHPRTKIYAWPARPFGVLNKNWVSNKHNFLSADFDLEKAHDTTWRFGIIRDFCILDFQGNMLNTIQSCLCDRTFRVRIDGTLSISFTQETGVPQGGVMSCTLFIIKNWTPFALYGRQLYFILCMLMICHLASSPATSYFVNARSSCQWISCEICRREWLQAQPIKKCLRSAFKKGIAPELEVYFNGHQLPVRSDHKFLGLILDSKLPCILHLKHLKQKCLKDMNV